MTKGRDAAPFLLVPDMSAQFIYNLNLKQLESAYNVLLKIT